MKTLWKQGLLKTSIGDATRIWNKAITIRQAKTIQAAKTEIKKYCLTLPILNKMDN